VGEYVTFYFTADDPDAPVEDWLSYRFGDDDGIADYASCPRWRQKYGGWTPPPRVHGHHEWSKSFLVPEQEWKWDYSFSTASAFCEVNGLGDGSEGGREGANPYWNPYWSPASASGRVEATR
jgi:hypothetical protein